MGNNNNHHHYDDKIVRARETQMTIIYKLTIVIKYIVINDMVACIHGNLWKAKKLN